MKRLFCPKAKNGLIKIGGVREIPGEKTVIVASLPRPCLTKTGGVCEIPGVKERARRIFFVAAESATCTHLARRKHRHHHWQLGLIELKYVFSAPSAPGCSPIPRDRATAPGPTHTAALAIRRKNGRRSQTRQFFKVALRETASNLYIFCWLNGRTLDSGQTERQLNLAVSAFSLFFCYSIAV